MGIHDAARSRLAVAARRLRAIAGTAAAGSARAGLALGEAAATLRHRLTDRGRRSASGPERAVDGSSAVSEWWAPSAQREAAAARATDPASPAGPGSGPGDGPATPGR